MQWEVQLRTPLVSYSQSKYSQSKYSQGKYSQSNTLSSRTAAASSAPRRVTLHRTKTQTWMVPKRRWNRWRWRRLARAPEAVAGRPVGRPLPGSAELPGAARRALRSRRSRAGALPRRCTLTLLADDGVEFNQGLLVRVLAEGTGVHPDGERRAAAGALLLHHGAGGGAQPLLEEWVWLYADNLGHSGDGEVPGWSTGQ